ncbi:hypothetical protein Zmor_019193 [Zophobas morio]|uniref:Chemosensory protein n=1 Tax=Zophobas morio TaxID=2755281 RepID=A0AA38I5I1_9CUCU|nr:hypothetical protein Zmor_019193 [Zophobas morio]
MIPIISVIVGITTVAAAPADHYQSRYDHLDIESILNNRRMVNYYAACLLSQGPCPPQGLDLKKVLPEALATNCIKCTEKQKAAAYRSIKRLKKEYPKIWAQLAVEWDPDNVYVRKFEASFESGKHAPAFSPPPVLFNRFGDTENSDSTTNKASSSTPSSTTSTTTTIRTTITTTKPTNKPFVYVTQPPLFVTKPPQAPPFTTVGANLQATVSFGTNLVGGIVRSLSTIGSKVVESGTKLANMVISAALRT